MAEAFIGLDLGTTGIKAVAYDLDDQQLALATRPTPTHHLPNGGGEYDANALWATATEVLREVTDQLVQTGHQVLGVATASMGEAGVLLDGGGQPVAPVISWFDPRTEPQAQWWSDHVGAERTKRIAAIAPRALFGAPKMLWTKANNPEAWAAGRHWLNMADWAAYRLSGEMATDHSLASRTMVFDLPNRRWSEELIDAGGLDRSMFCPLIESGRMVGRVTADAGAESGLPPGTAVGAGGQDHVCAALALGVTEPGTLLDSIGTAEALFLVTSTVDVTGRVADAGIGQGAHVEPGRTYAMVGVKPGGGSIDARRAEMGLDWPTFLATPEAEEVIDVLARAGQNRIGDLMEVTETAEIRHLAASGGSRNTRLIEQKQVLGGRPIEVAEVAEATALGAAILGRRAAANT